jgi:hypothetical protein
MAQITLTRGAHFGPADNAAEAILMQREALASAADQIVPADGAAQGLLELEKAGFSAAKG